MTIPLCLFLALAASACGSAQTERGGQPPGARPPAVYTVGRTLLGLPGHDRVTLASAPVTPLAGWLTPVAVPSPDGRFVAYNAWRELREDDPALSWEDQGISAGDPLARPSIRVHDLQSGTDSAYVVGAFSLAWRGDGAIAYFKGANRDYRAGVRYVGDVFVRGSVNDLPRRWTEQTDRYVVAGWAGPSLLVYRVRAGEALDVLALDGPGKRRVLASDAGLVAISPDGTSALVEHGPESGPPRVDLIAVSNGTKLASLDVSTVDPAVGVVGYAGDWQGDLVAAPSASGLVVFRIAGGRIELARTMRAAAGEGVAEPRFVGPSRVTGWTSSSSGGAFVDCDRVSGRSPALSHCPTPGASKAFPPGVAPSTTQAARRKEKCEMRIALLAALVLCLTEGPASAANGWWTFDRNTNLNSTLTWKWTYPPSPAEYSRSWRGGSGTTMDECEIGRGWLPSGWYAQKGHWDHYDGSKVRGRVWWVQDKTCRDGSTRRTELFIHSEETASNGQSCTSTYDDPFCWERESDYYSNGCIKVARPSPVASFPNDLGAAHATYHDYGGKSAHGAYDTSDANELYVYS